MSAQQPVERPVCAVERHRAVSSQERVSIADMVSVVVSEADAK